MKKNESGIEGLIREMTLEEKASLLSGAGFMNVKGIERLGIEPFTMTDGPHGLRKQTASDERVQMNQSVPATAFPTGSALGATWNPELLAKVARAIGLEARKEKVALLLAPAINIKRTPLCGRNFEYYSEDPYLTGALAEAYARGVQSTGVGATLKHFAAHNQESHRFVVDVRVDERAMREIYLAAFERAIAKAAPAAVMAAYNRLNGVYCTQNEWLLGKILRDEWGYEGVAISDMVAVDDRVAGLKAGLDLEMPGSGGFNDAKIVQAVRDGSLDEALVDRAVSRMLHLYENTEKVLGVEHNSDTVDFGEHHRLALEAAIEGTVLLKNDGVLPIPEGKRVALIGEYAVSPRFQGGGSSCICPTKTECLKESLASLYPAMTYCPGYRVDSDALAPELIQEAKAFARDADVAILCVGLTPTGETEGFDRKDLSLPPAHVALIEAVAESQKNIVVILSNGSPVSMPWLPRASAILEAYLNGQAGGHALALVLSGRENPSGKLAETFPIKAEDTPGWGFFPGNRARSEYREGIFVGYRHYDSARMHVLFTFGHGLSYTTFEYSDLSLPQGIVADGTQIMVSLTIRNAGARFGKETVQVYACPPRSEVYGPPQELKGFAKVGLEPGESRKITIELDGRAFAWYDETNAGWRTTPGRAEIRVGSSSRDIRLVGTVTLAGSPRAKRTWTRNDTLGDMIESGASEAAIRKIRSLLDPVYQSFATPGTSEALMFDIMEREMPIRTIELYHGLDGERILREIIDELNGA
ncbi:MAG TPA: glycoside hydrolase family 3 C-terminal domain-containing protein [Treponemataceae bacterium]|nr:glycoside hydrolase family 3 C-terminal domain-containing protein [Treponemataceae bacterium]